MKDPLLQGTNQTLDACPLQKELDKKNESMEENAEKVIVIF